jgi:hypothetical protein
MAGRTRIGAAEDVRAVEKARVVLGYCHRVASAASLGSG